MEKRRTTYTVQKLAHMANVSARTLHYYDEIGLLKPSARTAAGYRLYEEKDLLRLQQIMFFKELDVPLVTVQSLLDHPGFDPVQALQDHRRMLEMQAERLATLLNTIDKTIKKLTEADMELTNEELYEGFSKETVDRWEAEVRQRYDPAVVAESQKRVRKMSKEQWAAVKAEGDSLTRGLAALMDRDPGDAQVQALIARHYAWINNFYTPTPEIYRGLGDLYVTHPEFRANYDRYALNLADFMKAAMDYYADHNLE